MTDIPFVVVYHSDQDSPTQSDVDRAARFMAMNLHRSAGPRHDVYYEGRLLVFEAGDSRWSNAIPAEWAEPVPIQCTFMWFDDEGVQQQCPLTAGHPWDEANQPVPHSAKGISKEQARALLREGISSDDYAELAKRFDREMDDDAELAERLDPEHGVDAYYTQLAKKAAKKTKAAKKRTPKKVAGKAK